MKFLIPVFICLFATTASAEMLTCKRSKLSANGFKNKSAAESWFPRNFRIQLNGEEALSDLYGRGTVARDKGRMHISFVTAASNNLRTIVRITYIERSNRYTARLGANANYAQTPGARGKCAVS